MEDKPSNPLPVETNIEGEIYFEMEGDQADPNVVQDDNQGGEPVNLLFQAGDKSNLAGGLGSQIFKPRIQAAQQQRLGIGTPQIQGVETSRRWQEFSGLRSGGSAPGDGGNKPTATETRKFKIGGVNIPIRRHPKSVQPNSLVLYP